MIHIAHRGMHREAPENSRRAVEAAFESPADGVELDVRMLGDRTLVLHHDPVVTPRHRATSDGPRYRALASMDLDTFRRVLPYEPLTVPELLAMAPGGRRIILECKPHVNNLAFLRRLRTVLREFASPPPLTLSSDDFELLQELALETSLPLAPVLRRGGGTAETLLAGKHWSELHLARELCTRGRLENIRDRGGPPVIVWTVNTPEQWDQLDQSLLHGMMTDNPDLYTGSDAEPDAKESPP